MTLTSWFGWDLLPQTRSGITARADFWSSVARRRKSSSALAVVFASSGPLASRRPSGIASALWHRVGPLASRRPSGNACWLEALPGVSLLGGTALELLGDKMQGARTTRTADSAKKDLEEAKKECRCSAL